MKASKLPRNKTLMDYGISWDKDNSIYGIFSKYFPIIGNDYSNENMIRCYVETMHQNSERFKENGVFTSYSSDVFQILDHFSDQITRYKTGEESAITEEGYNTLLQNLNNTAKENNLKVYYSPLEYIRYAKKDIDFERVAMPLLKEILPYAISTLPQDRQDALKNKMCLTYCGIIEDHLKKRKASYEKGTLSDKEIERLEIKALTPDGISEELQGRIDEFGVIYNLILENGLVSYDAFLASQVNEINRINDNYDNLNLAADEACEHRKQKAAETFQREQEAADTECETLKEKNERHRLQSLQTESRKSEARAKRSAIVRNILYHSLSREERKKVDKINAENRAAGARKIDEVYNVIFDNFGSARIPAENTFDWEYCEYAKPKLVCDLVAEYSPDGIENQNVVVMSHGKLKYDTGFTRTGTPIYSGELELLGITKRDEDTIFTEFGFMDSASLNMHSMYSGEKISPDLEQDFAQVLFSDDLISLARRSNHRYLGAVSKSSGGDVRFGVNAVLKGPTSENTSLSALKYASNFEGIFRNEIRPKSKESATMKQFFQSRLKFSKDGTSLYERQSDAIREMNTKLYQRQNSFITKKVEEFEKIVGIKPKAGATTVENPATDAEEFGEV